MNEYQQEIDQEKFLKPKLYQFPEYGQPSAVFDFDDLENEEVLFVLCCRKEPGNENRSEHTAFVWRGSNFVIETQRTEQTKDLDEDTFIKKCIENYWGAQMVNSGQIKIKQETATEESDEFMYFFD